MTFDDLAYELGAHSKRRRHALRLVVQAYQEDETLADMPRDEVKPLLKHRASEMYKAECEDDLGPYGFIAIITVLAIVLGSVIGWCVTKFLDWIYDHHHHHVAVPHVTFDGDRL
jgi:hypothetical protein